ncbi:helix-turn-helix domain-containing protein [Streptomyces lydicus]
MTAMPRPDNDLSIRRFLDQPDVGPTVVHIALAAQLRRLRQARGISRESAGKALRNSDAKITRLERAQVGIKIADLADLLTLYGVLDEAERDTYFALAEQTKVPGWWAEYSDVLSDWHIGLEEAAALLRTHELQFFPGLLQTEDYARVVSRFGFPDALDSEIDRLVEVRMRRQRLLTAPHAPVLWAVLDESAVRRRFGGRRVMRAQLEHALEMSELPNVRLQVVPFNSEVDAAANTPFTILRFSEPELPDKVYLEQLTSGLYLDKEKEITQYTSIMDRLCTAAEEPKETEAFLHRLLTDLT